MATKLELEWSPEQISGWLAQTYPGEQALHVSTETIYRSLFIQARGVLRKELTAHLRTRRTMRRSKHATAKGQGRGGIVDAVSIRERPAEVEERAVPGHWEGDLLAGSANTHIATLVERQTRYLLLVRVAGKDTATVVDAIAAQVQTLPRQLRTSLTWDRGIELAECSLGRGQAVTRLTLDQEIEGSNPSAITFCCRAISLAHATANR